MVSAFLTATLDAGKEKPVQHQTMVMLPQIQQYYHDASDEFPSPFLELTFRNEGFRPVPLIMDSPVLHQALLETPSTE